VHVLGLLAVIGLSVAVFRFRPVEPAVTPQALADFVHRYALTEREAEVISHLVCGRDYRMIAETLFVSLKTVKAHVYNVYKKAAVKNRIALIEAVRQYR
jgi:DNA-binding NarL/FixJ family response regulator